MNARANTETIELACADSRIAVCPAIGGAVARFDWHGTDILRRASDTAIAQAQVRQMGCFPLLPYSNRIENATLRVGEEAFALRPNFPPEPHAIHGVGWLREWRVGPRSATSIRLDLAHAPDEDWPFRFEAHQAIVVGADALEIRLRIRNTDARAMPAGLGFHPCFPLRPGVRLRSEWLGMWTMGKDRLPVECAPAPPEADFREPRAVEGWRVDNCFTGWKRCAGLHYPSHCVELSASEALDRIVCFAPDDGRGFIALEPVSHVNNAFALASRGRRDTGMRLLAPDESWQVSMRIAVVGAPGP